MSKPQYTSEEIASIIEEHKQGKSALELCRKYSVSDTTFYKWRADAGLGKNRRKTAIGELRAENALLKAKLEEQHIRIVELEELRQISV